MSLQKLLTPQGVYQRSYTEIDMNKVMRWNLRGPPPVIRCHGLFILDENNDEGRSESCLKCCIKLLLNNGLMERFKISSRKEEHP